jgi:hypothetical protein
MQEVLDIIIDHLCRDFQTLRLCSLVSRTWLAPCRYHLFSCVYFTTELELERVTRWKIVPHLAQLVRKVIIGSGRRSTLRFGYMLKPHFSAGLHEVPLSKEFMVDITSLFPNAATLDLDFAKFHAPLDACKLIASFSSLHELLWTDIRFETDSPAHEVVPPPSLHVLRVVCSDEKRFAESLVSWFALHARRVPLEVFVAESALGINSLTPFITLLAPTLKFLDISEISSEYISAYPNFIIIERL